MKVGDTEFIDMPGDKQYELDLIAVHTQRTTDAIAARTARMAEAAGGRTLLRRQMERVGPYRYSTDTGTLSVLTGAAWKAAQTASASAAKKR
jgi:hypothetical protein